jgi:hypothetical protein
LTEIIIPYPSPFKPRSSTLQTRLDRWVTDKGKPTYQSAGFHGHNIRVSSLIPARSDTKRQFLNEPSASNYLIATFNPLDLHLLPTCRHRNPSLSIFVPLSGRWSLYKEPDSGAR